MTCSCYWCAEAATGHQAADAGMMAAAEARPEWSSMALRAIAAMPPASVFTADDLPCGGGKAAGAVLRNAARMGLVVKSGRYVASTRKANHARPQAEWIRLGVGMVEA